MNMDLQIIASFILCTMLTYSENASAQQQSNFTITVQFFLYRNPDSRIGSLPNQPCCNDIDCMRSNDNCTTCTENCNNYFIFCLRSPSSPTDQDGVMCPYGRLQTGVLSGGDDILFLTTDEQQVRNFNNSNPFTFDNILKSDTLELLVMTLDNGQLEGDSDILVEQFSTDIIVTKNSNFRETIGGQFGVASIRLSYSVSCAENYYGELCNVFCEDRNDSSGHYTCDNDGNIVCLSGFINPSTFCVCETSSEECNQVIASTVATLEVTNEIEDFERSLSVGVVVGAIIGSLVGIVLIITVIILMVLWMIRGGNQKWNVFSYMCHQSENLKNPYNVNDSEQCNTHQNPTYEDEAISVQGTARRSVQVASSPHNYDYIINIADHSANNKLQQSSTHESNDHSQHGNGSTSERSPLPYSYAVNTMSTAAATKPGNAKPTTPYSYVDNTLIQDMVLKAVHDADAERLRTLHTMRQQNDADVPTQHYETMQNCVL